MNVRSVRRLLVLVALAACSRSPGEVSLSFVWGAEEPTFERAVFLAARLESSGVVLQEAAPKRFSMDELIELDNVPNDRELVLIVEIRDGEFRNSRALYYGISERFEVHPGERLELTTLLEPGPPPFSPPFGPNPPSVEKLRLVRTPSERWLSAEEGVAPPGMGLLVFSGAEVAEAVNLDRVSIPDHGGFEVPIDAEDLQQIYVAVLSADNLLSDASDRPGLQATLVVRTTVTLPPSDRIYRTALISDARDPPAYAREAVADAELESLVRAVAVPVWHPQLNANRAPPGAYGGALAYDAKRGQVVSFGGRADRSSADVWVHDGDRWLDRTPIADGPVARFGHALAYDSARDRVLLFGGEDDAGAIRGDLWEWDGLRWREIAQASDRPAPRSGHGLVYDPRRGRVVLFGGRGADGQVLGDTWEWDGRGWTFAAAAAGPERSEQAMTFDGALARVVSFGGRSASGVEQDLWSFDGGTWRTERSNLGPSSRAGAAISFDQHRSKLVLFGGEDDNGARLGDLWEWEGGTWIVRTELGPSARARHAMAYSAAQKCVVIFGGSGGTSAALADTWTWDGVGFTDRTPTLSPPPSPRSEFAIAYDGDRDRVVIVGGAVNDVELSSEMWEWSPEGWRARGDIGFEWRGHQLAYDTLRRRLVLFGGSPPETYEWSDDAWIRMTPAHSPGARREHRMAFDELRGRTVLFGGRDDPYTWEWDGVDWVESAGAELLALEGHALAYDDFISRVVLFGGRFGNSLVSGPYAWDGRIWTDISGTPNIARTQSVLAYDSSRRQLMTHGGEEVTSSDPTVRVSDAVRVWDGALWNAVEVAGPRPSPRTLHGMIYDPARRRMVMFGGRSWEVSSAFGDLWTLEVPDAQRPGVEVVIELGAQLPESALIERIEIHAVSGGRGSFPIVGPGSVLRAWNARSAAFVEIAGNEASIDEPGAISAEVVSDAHELVDRDREILLRFEPRFGTGVGSDYAEVVAGSPQVRVDARLVEE